MQPHTYLQDLRLTRGELLKDMALKLDLRPSELSAIENGRQPMTASLFKKVQKVYNLPPEPDGKIPGLGGEVSEEVRRLRQRQEREVTPTVTFRRMPLIHNINKYFNTDFPHVDAFIHSFHHDEMSERYKTDADAKNDLLVFLNRLNHEDEGGI